jgi:hypothetical protein
VSAQASAVVLELQSAREAVNAVSRQLGADQAGKKLVILHEYAICGQQGSWYKVIVDAAAAAGGELSLQILPAKFVTLDGAAQFPEGIPPESALEPEPEPVSPGLPPHQQLSASYARGAAAAQPFTELSWIWADEGLSHGIIIYFQGIISQDYRVHVHGVHQHSLHQ